MIRFTILPALALIALALSFSFSHAQTQAGQFAAPDYYAVTFYADTCGACKILEPQIEKARADEALDRGNILFVKMDFSNKASINQSKLHAAALGIDGYVKRMGAKTGYMALLDAQGAELAKFTMDDDAAAIAQGITKAIAR